MLLLRTSTLLTPKWYLLIFSFNPVNVLEDCPTVPDKILSMLGCNPNINHILRTLVNLDNCVQVLAYAAWKSRHRSAETLWECFAGKRSASKRNGLCTDLWSTNCEHWYAWDQLSLQKEETSLPSFFCVWQSDDWVIVVRVVICDKIVHFPEIHKQT